MPGRIPITEEEFKDLCNKYTQEEIAKIKGATKGWVWSKMNRYGVKPVVVCEVCLERFQRANREKQCPACRKGPGKARSRPEYKPRKKAKGSNVSEIEKEMRKQGKGYADYQKAKTIEEFARVEV